MDPSFITYHYPPQKFLTFLFKMAQKYPWNNDSFSSHLISHFLQHPTGTNFLESKKADNVAHSFFRDSQFLFDLTIFSTHFFNMFQMRISCLHWPPWPCFSHKLASPISCLNCNTQHLTVLTSTHLSPAQCLHTAVNVNGKNFFCSQSSITAHFF